MLKLIKLLLYIYIYNDYKESFFLFTNFFYLKRKPSLVFRQKEERSGRRQDMQLPPSLL